MSVTPRKPKPSIGREAIWLAAFAVGAAFIFAIVGTAIELRQAHRVIQDANGGIPFRTDVGSITHWHVGREPGVQYQPHRTSWFDRAIQPVGISFSKIKAVRVPYRQVNDDWLLLLHCSRCDRLSVLDVRQTFVTDAGVRSLTTLHDLSELRLSGTCVSDSAVPFISEFKSLRKLDLEFTDITDSGVASLSQSRIPLQELDLSGTNVTDASPESLAKVTTLRILLMDQTDVSAQGVANLLQQRPLEVVSVIETQIDGDGLAWLRATFPYTGVIGSPD